MKKIVVDTGVPYPELDFFRTERDAVPPVDLHTDDPGLIIYTSGTTGNPKGAVLTQGNLLHDADNIIHTWEIAESDVLCHTLPLFHVHGLCFALHTALMAGSTVLLMDRFTPKSAIETLKKREGRDVCTVYMAVPAMYSLMMDFIPDDAPDFSHIRLWASGVRAVAGQRFRKNTKVAGSGTGGAGRHVGNRDEFFQPFARREKTPVPLGCRCPTSRSVSWIRRVSADMGTGETGEIWLKGPCIISEYWRKPEETSKTFEDGWFRTGDLGHVDEEGYYFLTDRIKHIIISGGENVSPKEVETVINRVPEDYGILRCGLAGREMG